MPNKFCLGLVEVINWNRISRTSSLFFLILAFGFGTVGAADLPPLVVPQGMGVNIHFTTGHERDLDLIRDAGFKFIRMDFVWAGIERKPGEYDFSAYDKLTASLEERGIRPLYILDYSNPLYETSQSAKNPINGHVEHDIASPQHPESIAAFARWAAAAAKHFAGQHVIWEIWNEPNISFWKPQPEVAQYSALALATARAVREADPQATIIGPASSGFPWEFLEAFLKSGVLEYLDAISVHPYRGGMPETAAADYARLRKLIERLAPPEKRQLPVISGEWGYSSNTKGVSPEWQAEYLVRQQLMNLLHGVPISIWYDWKNDGDDPGENEHNFGTVLPDLKPKPAFHAAQTLARELGGCQIAERLAVVNTNDIVLLLTDSSGRRKLAAWTLKEPHSATIALKFPVQAVSAVGLRGEPITVKLGEQTVEVPLSHAPCYLSFE